MSLVRWYPEYGMTFFADDELARDDVARPVWVPAVDVSETDKEYLIQAELPGVARDDIQITVEDHTLRLEGERKAPADGQDGSRQHLERPYGVFERCFCLPDDVDEASTSAEYQDGVLSLHLKKSPEAAPRSIEVRSG